VRALRRIPAEYLAVALATACAAFSLGFSAVYGHAPVPSCTTGQVTT
jgi:hypothetical protein